MITVLSLLALSGLHPVIPVPLTGPSRGLSRSLEDHVDPWDVVLDYDPSDSTVAEGAEIHIVDKMLRLAQKDMKYFQEERPAWEIDAKEEESKEDHVMGFNFTAWNKTYIPPPKGMGDAQTDKLMSKMIPEFDISKIKLKDDKKHNNTVVFQVLVKEGPENKVLGYSSKRLHVQIHAPKYAGAVNNELARYLSKVLAVSRKSIRIKQGVGTDIRKVRIPKSAVQEKVYIRKLIDEFGLEEVTASTYTV